MANVLEKWLKSFLQRDDTLKILSLVDLIMIILRMSGDS